VHSLFLGIVVIKLALLCQENVRSQLDSLFAKPISNRCFQSGNFASRKLFDFNLFIQDDQDAQGILARGIDVVFNSHFDDSGILR